MALKKLGRYDIICVLGKGAMGMVYEARDPNLDRRVAIKTIQVDALSERESAEYETRFRTEARSAARLQHPHIVSVYDSGRDGDVAYLVMEFVQGKDLKQLLASGTTFSLAQVSHLMCDLLSALDFAHRQKIVHRDVKPANLLVEADGRVKLTDFGVARIQDAGDATRTRGSMVGTLKYMAPEQVQGMDVDARADIFAAGIVLYQLLTGRRPFDGESAVDIIGQIVAATPPAPSTLNAQLPPAIDGVVAQALAPLREQRFANAQAFAIALQAAVGSDADQTIMPPPGRRPPGEWGTGKPDTARRRGRSGPVSSGDTSGSTVTQELELVYWKDVKDSADVVDLQGFLDRFPHGIYGDLARRRLTRLGGQVHDDQTRTALQTRVMDQTARQSGFPDTEQMSDKTLRLERSMAGADAAPAHGGDQTLAMLAAPGLPAKATAPDETALATAEARSAAAETADYAVHPASPPQTAQQDVNAVSHIKPKGRWTFLLALPLAVVLVIWSYGQTSIQQPELPVLPAAVPTTDPVGVGLVDARPPMSDPVPSMTAALPPAASTSAASLTAVTPVLTQSAPPVTGSERAVARGKSVAAKVAEAPMASAASTATAAVRAVPAAIAPLQVAGKSADASTVVPGAAAPGRPGSPENACAGRVLLGYQLCIRDQCATAAFAEHATCRQLRVVEQAREEQRNSR